MFCSDRPYSMMTAGRPDTRDAAARRGRIADLGDQFRIPRIDGQAFFNGMHGLIQRYALHSGSRARPAVGRFHGPHARILGGIKHVPWRILRAAARHRCMACVSVSKVRRACRLGVDVELGHRRPMVSVRSSGEAGGQERSGTSSRVSVDATNIGRLKENWRNWVPGHVSWALMLGLATRGSPRPLRRL